MDEGSFYFSASPLNATREQSLGATPGAALSGGGSGSAPAKGGSKGARHREAEEEQPPVMIVQTAPQSNYDEDLVENIYFQALKNKHRKLYARACERRHVICVPRMGTLDASQLSKDMIETHLLQPLLPPAAATTTTTAANSTSAVAPITTALSASASSLESPTLAKRLSASEPPHTHTTDAAAAAADHPKPRSVSTTSTSSATSATAAFETYNQRRVVIDSDKRLVETQAGFKIAIQATILFEESFYNSKDESFRVLCISRPLLPSASELAAGAAYGSSSFPAAAAAASTRSSTVLSSSSSLSSASASTLSASESVLFSASLGVPFGMSLPQSYEECMNFLWSDPENEPVFFRINESINLFNATFEFMSHSLRHTVDAAHTIYTRGMHSLLRTKLGALAKSNSVTMAVLKLSLETFILDGIHGKIMDGAGSTFAQLDTSFNRLTRALLDLSESDMEIRPDLAYGVTTAVSHIGRLNMVKTPLEKLHVLRRAIQSITAPPPTTTTGAAPFVLTPDDLIPILILIVIRSDVSNWHTNLWFMQNFQFASTGTDALSYNLTSFQAAVEHIKSDTFASFVRERLGIVTSATGRQAGQSSDALASRASSGNAAAASTAATATNTRGQTIAALLADAPSLTSDDGQTDGLAPGGRARAQSVFLPSAASSSLAASEASSPDATSNESPLLAATAGQLSAESSPSKSSTASRRSHSVNDALQLHASKQKDGLELLVANILQGGRGAVESFFKRVSGGQVREVKAILKAASLGRRASSVLRLDAADELGDAGGGKGAGFPGGAAATSSASSLAEPSAETVAKLCHPLCSCPKCKEVIAAAKQAREPDTSTTASLAGTSLSSSVSNLSESSQAHGVTPSTAAMPSAMDASVTIYSRDNEGCTALHVAARAGHSDMARVLIDYGAIVNATNYLGATPLHFACQRNHVEVVKVLLAKGADMGATDNEGNTPLHVCSLHGHLECAKEIVRSESRGVSSLMHVVDVNMPNSRGNTPLHLASKWGFIEIVHLLLRHGAISDLRNNRNETPLQCAQNKKIVELIRSETEEDASAFGNYEESRIADSPARGTLPSTVSPYAKLERAKTSPALSLGAREDVLHETPLFSAEMNEEQVRYGAEVDSLFRAIDDDDVQLVKFKLNIVDAQDGSGPVVRSTPTDTLSLMCHPLCACDKCKKLQTTRHVGLDINCSNKDGVTPLHHASLHGHTEIVALLIRCGANINMRNTHGHTPLHFACQYNHQKVVDTLLQASARSNAKDSNGNTPLHFCAGNGHLECAALLLQKGVNVNAVNKRGDTALHTASRWGYGAMVVLLLQHGASTTMLNERNQTPLQCAKSEHVMSLIVSAAASNAFGSYANPTKPGSAPGAVKGGGGGGVPGAGEHAAMQTAGSDGGPAAVSPAIFALASIAQQDDSSRIGSGGDSAAATVDQRPSELVAPGEFASTLSAKPSDAPSPFVLSSPSKSRHGRSFGNATPPLLAHGSRSRTSSSISLPAGFASAPTTPTKSHRFEEDLDTSGFKPRQQQPQQHQQQQQEQQHAALLSTSSSSVSSLIPRQRTDSTITLRSDTLSHRSEHEEDDTDTPPKPSEPGVAKPRSLSTDNAPSFASPASPNIVPGTGFIPAMKSRAPKARVESSQVTADALLASESPSTALQEKLSLFSFGSAPGNGSGSPATEAPAVASPLDPFGAAPLAQRTRALSKAAPLSPGHAAHAEAAPPAASSVSSVMSGASSIGSAGRAASRSVIGDIFNIMETSDMAQGTRALLQSIGTFNKTRLRPAPLTRDVSAPFIDTQLKLSISINHFDTNKLKRTTTIDKSRPSIPAELLDGAADAPAAQTDDAGADGLQE